MDKFIGVKIIQAEPMTMEEASRYFNRPFETTAATKDPDGYRVVYEDGYESWSPKSVFEEAYRRTNGLTFGLALEALKKGFHLARKGWNGKGMFVVYQKGYPQGIPCNRQTAIAWGLNEGELFECNPYLQIKNVDGSHSMWVPSISDVLSEDWEIV